MFHSSPLIQPSPFTSIGLEAAQVPSAAATAETGVAAGSVAQPASAAVPTRSDGMMSAFMGASCLCAAPLTSPEVI